MSTTKPVTVGRGKPRNKKRNNKKKRGKGNVVLTSKPINNLIPAVEYLKPEYYDVRDDIKEMFGTKENYVKWAEMVNKLSASGPDIRNATESLGINGFFSDSASETNKIVVPINTESLVGLAVYIVSNAYNHGFRQESASLNKEWYPYYAFLFLYKCLISVVSGSQIDAPKVKIPDAILEVFAALSPKSGTQLGAGTLGYSWQLNNPNFNPGPSFNYPSTGTQNGLYTFFTATSSLESGYNIMVAPSTPSYDNTVGAEAFSALVTFMNKRLVGSAKKYQPFAPRDYNLEGTMMERSTSSFAATSLVFGGGLIGGYASTLASNETTIKHRKFCVFSQDKSLDRGFRQHVQTGGDSNWLMCSLLLQQSKFEVKNPNYPVFKPVDFYEFADCLALALCDAFTNAYHATNFNVTDIPNLGLTAIEFQIILRKIMMKNFGATQAGVQSLRFYPTPLGSTDDFIPFLCNSCGSSSSNNASIKLPLFAVENLNALKARAVYPSVNPRTKKQMDNYPRYYIPVVGKYTNSVFPENRYQFKDSEGNMQNLFVPGVGAFNIVDGSLNQKYIDMDCSPKITLDMDKFNSVMTILSPFFQQLQMYTGDPGCIPLTVIADCRIIVEKKTDVLKRDVCEKCGGEKEGCSSCRKEKKKKKGPQVVTYEKMLVSTITQQIPITDLQVIKKAFVCPEYRLFVSNAGVGSITTSQLRSYTAEMWIEYEGQSYASSTDGNYTDMEAIRKQWVTNCVKNQFADDNTIVKQLLALTKQGKAGLLGSLVGAFGGEVVSSALKTVGSFIPY